MQRVLSADIWNEIGKRAKTADTRKAAIAYFTKDLVGFRAADVLVVDASSHAIRTGQTDAKLLQKLHRAGVRLFSQEGLHAKVLLLDGYSVVGSANMSASSARLIEAAVISDNAVIASGVSTPSPCSPPTLKSLHYRVRRSKSGR
jgi:phosphatidylserine/phosphatidylglycerophosphate/cardiolipin synthase-like enzyme